MACGTVQFSYQYDTENSHRCVICCSTLAVALWGNNLKQVVHTHVPLSPSSINWYQCKSWGVNRQAHQAMHLPRIHGLAV